MRERRSNLLNLFASWLVRPVTATPPPPRRPVRMSMPEAEVLARRLEALGLRQAAAVRVTNNQSVMVSLSARGVLRMHRGYAHAPDRVLKAVVRFLAPHTPREARRAARTEVLGYRPFLVEAAAPRTPRAADRPQPGDHALIARLSVLYAEFNRRHFDGLLPVVPIVLSGRMRSRLGQVSFARHGGAPGEITLNRRHVVGHGWDEAAHTLLHEMVHVWQHAAGRPVDHGPGFRAKAEAVGITPSARRSVRTTRSRGAAARYD